MRLFQRPLADLPLAAARRVGRDRVRESERSGSRQTRRARVRMWSRTCCYRAALVASALLVLLALVPVRALAAAFDTSGSDWEGASELVRLARGELGSARVVVTGQLDYADLKPEDGVLLLFPEKSLDVDQLAKFMRAGGRVVMLDDFGRGDALLRHFRMGRVPLPRRPAEFLRGNPQLALAEPASAHPVVAEVSRVVTNHATGLSHDNLSPVLKVRAQEGEPDVVVAVAGAVGQGRLLAVGDPSIVINAMLRYAGNKAFARGLVRYAVDHDVWGKRGGRLFILSGAFEQKGGFGGEEDTATDVLRALRDALDTVRREGMPAVLAYAFAIAIGLALVVWVGSRAGRVHKPLVPRFVRRVPAVAQGGVAGHAAVIGAPQTSRVLAVLELKSALEEQLTTMLGASKVPPQQELLTEVAAARLLDAEGLHTLRQLLLRMSNVETMVVFQRNGGMVQPVRDNEVVSIARTVKQLLDRAEASRNASASAAGHPWTEAGGAL